MTESIYKRFFRLVYPFWPILLLSGVASIIYVVFNSLSVWLTASLINNILSDFPKIIAEQSAWETATDLSVNEQLKYFTNKIVLRADPVQSLKVLCIVILLVFLLKNIFLYIKNILTSRVQLSLVTDIRNRLYEHIHSLSMRYFDSKSTGELSSIIINDVGVMQSALTTTFQKLIVEPINILVFMTILFVISWKLTLIALIIVPVTGILFISIGRSMRRKSRRTQKKIARIMDIITETISSMRIIKTFFTKDREIHNFKNESIKYFHLLFRRAKLGKLGSPVTEMLGVIIGVILLWIGGVEVIVNQTLTPEDFIRFILILFSVLAPIKQLTGVNIQIQKSLASAERVFNVIDTTPHIVEVKNPIEISSFNKEIVFDNVSFHYDTNNEKVLGNISFRISKGEIVALVGPSGAGKSTIADLIPRFYDVKEGFISIDEQDIRNLKIQSLRNLLGIVSQEVILFNDSVKNNIKYGLSKIDGDQIVTAAEMANARDFIEKMPLGFDTVIGERGVKLSGGQKQRIAIARAILRNPPILILDEATSSLDTESEKLVQEAIENLMKDRTVIVIAHRLSTVVNADKIVVLKEGRIVEMGTHDELLQQNGQYKKLYDVQFKDTRKSNIVSF